LVLHSVCVCVCVCVCVYSSKILECTFLIVHQTSVFCFSVVPRVTPHHINRGVAA